MPASWQIVPFGGCIAKSVGYSLAFAVLAGTVGCAAIRQQVSKRCENCSSLCKQACEVKEQGYPEQAHLLLNEAKRQRPNDLETCRQMAESLWECGLRADAISEYKRLIQLHPSDVRLYERLAVMTWSEGRAIEAADFADSALRLSPNCPDALLIKARTLVARRDLDTAAATYIRLTTIEPEHVDAKLELADIHMQRGHTCQACTVLRDLLLESDLDAAQQVETEWNLGLAYAAANRWSESADHLNRVASQRDTSGADRQVLMLANTMAGQDVGGVISQTTQVSAKRAPKPANSTWVAVRDRLLDPAKFADVGFLTSESDSEVVRADFSRTAQANPREDNSYHRQNSLGR